MLALSAMVPAHAQDRMSAVDADQAARQGKIVLIDIRTPDEWRETGVPASGHAITMHQDERRFLAEIEALTGGSKTQPIALVCATGSRSARMQAYLRRAGYTMVTDVSEGMLGGLLSRGWLKSKLEVRRWSPGQSAPVSLAPKP
jgi:rhodanese-related sulfurtransferase